VQGLADNLSSASLEEPNRPAKEKISLSTVIQTQFENLQND